MVLVILSIEIVYESKKCKVKPVKVIVKSGKDSITYYFAKYYVILGQVIRDTLASITYYFFSPFYFHF